MVEFIDSISSVKKGFLLIFEVHPIKRVCCVLLVEAGNLASVTRRGGPSDRAQASHSGL